MFTAAAALGVGPTRVIELLDQMGGSALAQTGAYPRRSVNIVAGTGSLSWFTLVWPVPGVIKNFQSTFSYDVPTKAALIPSGMGQFEGRSLYVRSVNNQPLWQKYGERKLVTALMCGRSNAHEVAPTVASNTNTIPDGVGGAVGLFAGQASIQSTLKALVPTIGIKFGGSEMPFGRAPGASPPASVVDANAMVGLFSSAASQLASRLSIKGNQDLFDLYYKGFLGLTRTANRLTYSRAQADSRVAVGLLAKNLGDALRPAAGQVAAWCGPPGGTPQAPKNEKVDFMAQALIVTANAFRANLTSQVNIPVFNDDPHSAFNDPTTSGQIADQIVNILENFMAYLDDPALSKDVVSGKKLSDTVVLTVHGDTPKEPYVRNNWPDSSPGGSNWVYVMSQGLVKPGWFGDIQPGKKTNYDPATGQISAGVPDQTVLDGALSAILFAVTNGDDRRVRDFTTAVNYNGLVNPLLAS